MRLVRGYLSARFIEGYASIEQFVSLGRHHQAGSKLPASEDMLLKVEFVNRGAYKLQLSNSPS